MIIAPVTMRFSFIVPPITDLLYITLRYHALMILTSLIYEIISIIRSLFLFFFFQMIELYRLPVTVSTFLKSLYSPPPPFIFQMHTKKKLWHSNLLFIRLLICLETILNYVYFYRRYLVT